MSRMVCLDRAPGLRSALLAGAAALVILLDAAVAHAATPAATPAPGASVASAASQTSAALPPPLAPELPPPNPVGTPALSNNLPAATAGARQPAPVDPAPGRMSPTAPMVQSAAGAPATVPTPLAPSVSTPVPPPATTAATAAVASAGSLTQVALVLVLVVGLIAAAAWLLKRLGMTRNAGGTTVRIISGVSLSNRERILVVEVADQWIVVGVAPGCINTLATMPRQESTSASASMPTPAGSNFALWLKQTIDKRGGAGTGKSNDK